MLSNPYAESSGGKSDETSTSSASRSRTALPYSLRLSRLMSPRPGLGCAAAVRSSSVSSHDTSVLYVASSGRGTPCGGIDRAQLAHHALPHLGRLSWVRDVGALE